MMAGETSEEKKKRESSKLTKIAKTMQENTFSVATKMRIQKK